MSPGGRQRVGDVIDAGQAALIILGEVTVEQAHSADPKAQKDVAKELEVSTKASIRQSGRLGR
jgi:hypothetical protein